MMKLKETRKLHADDLRNLCILHSWYTKGDNDEYASLLNHVRRLDNVSTENIVTIAQDILDHSETAYTLESICFEIAQICNSHFAAPAWDEEPLPDNRVDFSKLSYSELCEFLERNGTRI